MQQSEGRKLGLFKVLSTLLLLIAMSALRAHAFAGTSPDCPPNTGSSLRPATMECFTIVPRTWALTGAMEVGRAFPPVSAIDSQTCGASRGTACGAYQQHPAP